MSYADYYEVLGVARDATTAQINKRYRSLAKQYHPDVSKEPDAEERFKGIGEAYEVLKDPEKRALYDKWGPSWRAVSEGRAPAVDPNAVRFDFGQYGVGSNLNDLNAIFEQVFGGTGPGRARGMRGKARAAEQETTLELSVLKAFQGGPTEIQFLEPQTGQKRKLTVNVPAGVRDGQRIRLAGQGRGRGDLILLVRLLADETFRVEGDDVRVTLRIAPHEAALGINAPLETLDGRVKVRVPPGSSSGRVIRLRERGYPRRGGGRGDLLAEIRIVVPPETTPDERRLYEELARVSRFDPREG